MALFGEVVSQDRWQIVFRVATQKGDAPGYGIQGEHKILKAEIRTLRRRNLMATPPREFDELELSPLTLDRLAHHSFPSN